MAALSELKALAGCKDAELRTVILVLCMTTPTPPAGEGDQHAPPTLRAPQPCERQQEAAFAARPPDAGSSLRFRTAGAGPSRRP
jgi:hypothetical protein